MYIYYKALSFGKDVRIKNFHIDMAADNKGTVQTARMRRLFSAFVVRMTWLILDCSDCMLQ